jgi:hypothetical protein
LRLPGRILAGWQARYPGDRRAGLALLAAARQQGDLAGASRLAAELARRFPADAEIAAQQAELAYLAVATSMWAGDDGRAALGAAERDLARATALAPNDPRVKRLKAGLQGTPTP